MLIDTSRRVEKFKERVKKQADVAVDRKGKKVKRASKALSKEKTVDNAPKKIGQDSTKST